MRFARSTQAPVPVWPSRAAGCAASASEHCATRSPSTASTPSATRSHAPSHRPTRSTRSTRRSPRSCSGFLTLAGFGIESCEREEHLLSSGFDGEGHTLDQETMEKLFGLSGRIGGEAVIPTAIEKRLAQKTRTERLFTIRWRVV